MAMTPLPTGVGGTLFAGGGGIGGPAGGQGGATAPGSVHAPIQGKGAVSTNLGSPHSGLRSTITKGDPMSRLMGQYGKGHSFGNIMGGVPGGASPLKQIRGGTGQMKRIRGGLGPGKVGQAGGSSDYSMTNADPE